MQEMEEKNLLCSPTGYIFSWFDVKTNIGIHCKTEITWYHESFSKNAIRGPHNRRVGTRKLPRYNYRRLSQKGSKRRREKTSEHRLWTLDESIFDVIRRKYNQ